MCWPVEGNPGIVHVAAPLCRGKLPALPHNAGVPSTEKFNVPVAVAPAPAMVMCSLTGAFDPTIGACTLKSIVGDVPDWIADSTGSTTLAELGATVVLPRNVAVKS